MRIFVTLTVWMSAWLLWSGLYKPLLISLGVLSCFLVLVLSLRMELFNRDTYSLHLVPRLLPFWAWLANEIVKANVQVAKIVLSPKMQISPTVIRIDALPADAVGQAILGNAITLTPGSVTVDDHEGKLFVHCLTAEGAEALAEGEMNRRVAALTGG
ncbi:MAG: Na+/H+ antiporter subunit E [Pseudomonadota bacterium]